MTKSDARLSADTEEVPRGSKVILYRGESWTTCNLCCGEGGIEQPRPQHDDPYFAVVFKCPNCNGTGWECE